MQALQDNQVALCTISPEDCIHSDVHGVFEGTAKGNETFTIQMSSVTVYTVDEDRQVCDRSFT